MRPLPHDPRQIHHIWSIARRVLEAMGGHPPLPPLGARAEEAAAFHRAFLEQASRMGIALEAAQQAARMAAGLGLVESFLDPAVEEIILREGTVRVLFRKPQEASAGLLLPNFLPPDAVASLAARVADATGRSLTGARRFVTTDLDRPGLGRVRLAAALPPLSAGAAVNLRLFPETPIPFETIARDLGIPPADQERLRAALDQPRALLIAGPFAAGKTTLLNALLLAAVAEGRMPAVVEGFREIALPAHQALMIEEPDPALLDRAIADAVLRMRADLLAVGEITTPEEARRFMWAALVGRPALATLHGATPGQAMALLRGLLRRAGEPPEGIEEMIREGLGGIAVLAYDPGAHRRSWAGLYDPDGRPL